MAGALTTFTNQPISSLSDWILIPLGPTAEEGSSHSRIISDKAGSNQVLTMPTSGGMNFVIA